MSKAKVTKLERRALLYFARRARAYWMFIPRGRWSYRLWWIAIDLLPYPNDWRASWKWAADVAESMAFTGSPSRIRAARRGTK